MTIAQCSSLASIGRSEQPIMHLNNRMITLVAVALAAMLTLTACDATTSLPGETADTGAEPAAAEPAAQESEAEEPAAEEQVAEDQAAPLPTAANLTVGALRANSESESESAPAFISDAAQPLPYDIYLPEGFAIHIYADDVPGARSMALGENGTLFVGTRTGGSVYAVVDGDQDYVADEVITLAEGLNSPNGVAVRDGSLYVAEIDRVLRYDAMEANLISVPEPVVVSEEFPSDSHHGWKYIAFGPDDKLYVPVGAPCNVCETADDPHGKIYRMNPDGSELEVVARGMRNTVGFDWHPETGDLWWTDNGRDMMGDDIPPDELNHSTEPGQHFGFPYCHGGTIADPEFGNGRSCDEFVAPAQQLGPHVAALGMTFYTGDQFPAEYGNQIFIPEHGSWNRTEPIGYRVTLVRLDENGEATSYEIFAEGWLAEDGTVHGRPVDLLVLPDGSMLLSDDNSGMIYRIVYQG